MSIKIAVINTQSASTFCSLDPTCSTRGFGVDLAQMICQLLSLNCTFVSYPSIAWGDVDESGNATGLIGDIQRGRYDLSLPIMMATYRRSKAVAFSKNYFYLDLALLTRTPKTDSNRFNWSLLFVFQWPVIVLFFCTLFLITSLVVLKNSKLFVAKPSNTLRDLVLTFVETCFSLVTVQYSPKFKRFSIRVVVCAWFLPIIVLSSTYTGILFSQKVTQINDPPFVDMESFVKCLEDKRCRSIMPSTENSFYLQLTAFDRVKKALEYNPVLIKPDYEIRETILDEQNVYLVWFWDKQQLLYNNKGDDCDYYIVTTLYTQPCSFAMSKTSSIIDAFDRLALSFRESGVADAILKKYAAPTHCGKEVRGSSSWLDEGRGLYAFRTIFYFYIAGIIGCAIAIAIEIVLVWGQKQKSIGRLQIVSA